MWESLYWIHLSQNRNQLQAVVSKVMNNFLLYSAANTLSSWRAIVFQERLYLLHLIILGDRSLKLTSNIHTAKYNYRCNDRQQIPAFYKFRGLYPVHKSMSMSLLSDVTRKRTVSFCRVETSKKNYKHFDPCRLGYLVVS